MFTKITSRHKKQLDQELNFLSERIEIDGLKPEHDVRLGTYYIDALKFDAGIQKLKENNRKISDNKLFQNCLDHGIFLQLLYEKSHKYVISPTLFELREIGEMLTTAERENIYPRIESEIEDRLYTDLLGAKVIMEPRPLRRLIMSLITSDKKFRGYLQLVTKMTHVALTTENDKKRFDELIDLLTSYNSFVEMISIDTVHFLTLEKLLTQIRKVYLTNFSVIKFNQKHLRFLKALSSHCFINEYIYSIDKIESENVANLELELKTENKKSSAYKIKLLIYACYQNVNSISGLELPFKKEKLFEKIITNKANKLSEEEIKASIPVHLKLKDKVSKDVQSQYEENPYPRWENIQIPQKKVPIGPWLCSYSKYFNNKHIYRLKNPQILVAGTGTGQQAIGAATVINNCNVDAFDLSKSSLSYAIRKSKELDVKNINFFQADLFELDFLDREYDLIQCSGVLHHTNDPLSGLLSLKEKCAKTGVIQIGLYSKIARFHLNKIRDEIKNSGIGDTKEEMLDFRTKLLTDENFKDEVKVIAQWGDFYSTSMFRDLCFHKHEIQFDCLEIENLIAEAGLNFICMMTQNHQRIEFEKKTKKLAGEASLLDWHNFELENQHFFNEMYNIILTPS